MDLIVAGVSFKTHAIGQREACVVQLPAKGIYGVVPLATCNRVEVYAAVEEGTSPAFFNIAPGYLYRNEEAFLHLAKVACGLDSMVLGETEVFGQVKEAYDRSLRQKTVCALLNKVFQKVFQMTKKVRTETGISRYPVSVSSVAMMLLEQIFGEFKNLRALVVGLGEMGTQTALALSKRGVENLVVINRTESKAREFAEKVGGSSFFAPWENLTAVLPEMDVVVSSTAAPHFILSKEMLSKADRFKVLIDLGVPRDIDPAIGAGEGHFLYNVDDLKEIAQKNLASREREAKLALEMIGEFCCKQNFGRVAHLVRVLP